MEILDAHGASAAADIALCADVARTLEKFYPNHMWLVGADSFAGRVTVDLPYEKPVALKNYGYLLHLSSIQAAGAEAKVMRAGGELLERFGLTRGAATENSHAYATEHGLDITGHIV